MVTRYKNKSWHCKCEDNQKHKFSLPKFLYKLQIETNKGRDANKV